MLIYVLGAVTATLVVYFSALVSAHTTPEHVKVRLRMARNRVAWLLVGSALVGCDGGGLLVAQGSGGGATTTTATDACDGACVAPAICGIGCGTEPGCYTPGGSKTPGPNDCPACFFAPNGGECKAPGFPVAYFCQSGAAPLGGCIAGAGANIECCPSGP